MGKGITTHQRRSRWLALVCCVGAIVLLLTRSPQTIAKTTALPPSQYASTITAPFNQPNYYPIKPTPPSKFYRPVSEWTGRLILPSAEQYQQFAKSKQETDWAWFEVYTAPANYKALIGKTIRLGWQNVPIVKKYVEVASQDVKFVESAQKAFQAGVINPIRLNGRKQVGPIQSLAGGHPYDDVVVALRGAIAVEAPPPVDPTLPPPPPPAKPKLPLPQPPTPASPLASPPPAAPFAPATVRIQREPIQETGRYVALVKFLEAVKPPAAAGLPKACPGSQPCESDRIRVQHYNPKTRQFDGPQEVVHIPQQPADVNGLFNMTTRDLVTSPAGEEGWYIYGAADQNNIFTVQSYQPRSLVQLQPQQTITGLTNAINYVTNQNWDNVRDRKGSVQTVLVSGKDQENAKPVWKVGDRALVMHLYGGRGGTQPNSEKLIAGTYAGHFSFGLAQVIADPFTKDPILNVDYLQVYGNGNDGTLSGPTTWSNYMGNLRRGFLGIRPVSDVLVKLDALTDDYTFGKTRFSFFNELLGELSLIGARYRIGDGSGDSTITSATSCVQDSAQGIFLTLVRFREKIEANPGAVQWMRDHPDDPNTQRFQRLVKLAQDMADQLTPMGVVRWDWKENAKILTGVHPDRPFTSIDNFQPKNLATGLISWRTAMPRQAHDELAMLFLQNNATLWFLRPNQVGGADPTLAPLKPTLLFGGWTIPFTNISPLAHLVIRTFGGVTVPSWLSWLWTFLLLLLFGAIATAIGLFTGFVTVNPSPTAWPHKTLTLARMLIVPALVEEYVFRVLLLPYPKQWISAFSWWSWALLAWGIYVAFHWFRQRRHRRRRTRTTSPVFLILVAIFGFFAILVYRLTVSLWTITLFHWLVVAVWWFVLGGKKQVAPRRGY